MVRQIAGGDIKRLGKLCMDIPEIKRKGKERGYIQARQLLLLQGELMELWSKGRALLPF